MPTLASEPQTSEALDASAPPSPRRGLSPWLWLGLPVVFIAMPLVMPLVTRTHDDWYKWTMSERCGVSENGTVVALIVALVYLVRLLRRHRQLPRVLTVLLCLMAVACFFFLAEEASWGQHWIGYGTPESVKEVNTQGEFNLHNVDWLRFWLNATPRRLMMLAILAAGLVAPLVVLPWRKRIDAAGGFWSLALPTWRVVPMTLLTVCNDFPGRIVIHWYERLNEPLPANAYLRQALVTPAAEFRELGFALVILLCIISLYRRLGPARPC